MANALNTVLLDGSGYWSHQNNGQLQTDHGGKN